MGESKEFFAASDKVFQAVQAAPGDQKAQAAFNTVSECAEVLDGTNGDLMRDVISGAAYGAVLAAVGDPSLTDEQKANITASTMSGVKRAAAERFPQVSKADLAKYAVFGASHAITSSKKLKDKVPEQGRVMWNVIVGAAQAALEGQTASALGTAAAPRAARDAAQTRQGNEGGIAATLAANRFGAYSSHDQVAAATTSAAAPSSPSQSLGSASAAAEERVAASPPLSWGPPAMRDGVVITSAQSPAGPRASGLHVQPSLSTSSAPPPSSHRLADGAVTGQASAPAVAVVDSAPAVAADAKPAPHTTAAEALKKAREKMKNFRDDPSVLNTRQVEYWISDMNVLAQKDENQADLALQVQVGLMQHFVSKLKDERSDEKVPTPVKDATRMYIEVYKRAGGKESDLAQLEQIPYPQARLLAARVAAQEAVQAAQASDAKSCAVAVEVAAKHVAENANLSEENQRKYTSGLVTSMLGTRNVGRTAATFESLDSMADTILSSGGLYNPMRIATEIEKHYGRLSIGYGDKSEKIKAKSDRIFKAIGDATPHASTGFNLGAALKTRGALMMKAFEDIDRQTEISNKDKQKLKEDIAFRLIDATVRKVLPEGAPQRERSTPAKAMAGEFVGASIAAGVGYVGSKVLGVGLWQGSWAATWATLSSAASLAPTSASVVAASGFAVMAICAAGIYGVAKLVSHLPDLWKGVPTAERKEAARCFMEATMMQAQAAGGESLDKTLAEIEKVFVAAGKKDRMDLQPAARKMAALCRKLEPGIEESGKTKDGHSARETRRRGAADPDDTYLGHTM